MSENHIGGPRVAGTCREQNDRKLQTLRRAVAEPDHFSGPAAPSPGYAGH